MGTTALPRRTFSVLVFLMSLFSVTLQGLSEPAAAAGAPPPPGVLFTPSSIAFGKVGVGVTSAPIALTITNNTAAPIGFLSSSNASDFKFQVGSCGSIVNMTLLASGASCSYSLTFTPSTLGAVSASFTVGTTANPVTYSLSGTGVAAGVTVSPATTSFGSIGLGTTSNPQTITVYNYSSSPAVLLSTSNLGKFQIQQTTCGPLFNGNELAVGGACSFVVSFTPGALGTVSGTATVGTTTNPVLTTITGTGVAEGIVFSPASANFGNVTVGATSPPINITISNYTGSSIGILSSTNLNNFNIQQTACGPLMNGGLLEVGGSCSFTATFSPAAAGTTTGSATIGTAKSSMVFTLTGQGASGVLAANPGGPYSASTGQAISFSGSQSTAPTGQSLSYLWNFNDGGNSTLANPTHAYAAAGTYGALLQVTDTSGGTSSATAVVTVTNNPGPLSLVQTITPAPNAAGWNTTPVTVSFTCSDSLYKVTSCPPSVVVSAAGANQSISATAKDSSGNTAFAQLVVNLELKPPSITAVVSPAPNLAGWNRAPATVNYTCTASTSPILVCPPANQFATEVSAQLSTGTVLDVAGNSATASIVVKVDLTPPVVNVGLPSNGSTIALSSGSIGISGTVSDNSSGVASLTCNGVAATLSPGKFSCGATLVSGANTIAIQATDVAGNVTSSALNLTYAPAPAIHIIAPTNLGITNITPVTVNGTISDPKAGLTINGISVPQSSGSFSTQVPLVEGLNVLSAVATGTSGVSGSSVVEITLDTTPPHVAIHSPAQGTTTTAASVTVSGLANDVVVGTVNLADVQVKVNGTAAQVANRSFSAVDVPLALGLNTIQATAIDRAGNTSSTSITINRVLAGQPPAPAIGTAVLTQWLNIVSGNNQSGVVGAALASPVVVSLSDPSNHPLANRPVVFKVTGNNGQVSANGAPASRGAVVTTDANGQAQVVWTLGQRAGAGNNMLQVSTALAVSPLTISASGVTGTGVQVVVDSGNQQTGVLGQPLPFPFVVDVVDAGHNRVPGVPVTFTVKKGGGNFAGTPTDTITSDSNGRAIVILTAGTQEGINNNIVEATVPGNLGLPAAFVATAKAPGNIADTTITGVVVDNSSVPIPGVTMHLYKTNQGNANNLPVQVGPSVQTDQNGAFLIPNAPVGFFKLMADGGTATGKQTFPVLEYDIVTVAGIENTVGMPIYLPALDTVNKVCVDETHGGTLSLPQYPGFALTILPGSATFPGGARTGCVSATPVNGDKVPMAPGFGQQPRFIVTIQPVGTMFNPPAPLTLPNVDGLKPNAVTEMYSYDHDLSMFTAIGTGTVTPDGSQIVSDAGVGVLKAGWHCGGDPNTTGSAGTCPQCQACNGSDCAADPKQDGDPAPDNKCMVCKGGALTQVPDGDPVSMKYTLNSLSSLIEEVNSVLVALQISKDVKLPEFSGTFEEKLTPHCCEDDPNGQTKELSGSLSVETPELSFRPQLPPYTGDYELTIFGQEYGLAYGIEVTASASASVSLTAETKCTEPTEWSGSVEGAVELGLDAFGEIKNPFVKPECGPKKNEPCNLAEVKGGATTGVKVTAEVKEKEIDIGEVKFDGVNLGLEVSLLDGTFLSFTYNFSIQVIPEETISEPFVIPLPSL